MKVFTVIGQAWTPNGQADVTQRTMDMAERLTEGWQASDIVEYGADDKIVWRKWHLCRYAFEHLVDDAYGINVLRIVPSMTTKTRVWVSDHPMAFVRDVRDRATELFHGGNMSGKTYLVRPGVPLPASFYCIPLYGERVIVHHLPSNGKA